MIGQTLGHYRVLEKLGEGGMGVVYRARDEHLNRDVAIKVLPEEFARDAERLARFRREAQLLASLNHPNIAAIYGLEEQDGLRYLVLEYVPGQTLAERIGTSVPAAGRTRGSAATALPVEEALEICKQIAEALEAAHEKGVIHRDLKPANVKVTPEGKVKVLDFGLAKALEPEGSAADLSKSPTISAVASRAGVILGTAAYMSPEQARARPVDKRTDIWAFGCVLYECLSGKQAFGGESITDAIAAIIKNEPEWSALPAETPAAVRVLLRRCLQKDPRERLRDAGDLRLEMADALVAPPTELPRPQPRNWWRWAALMAAAAIAVTGLAIWKLSPVPPTAPSLRQVTRSTLPLGPAENLALQLALSPDGRQLVYAAGRGSATQLFLRQMDQPAATAIPRTEGASGPFFSPDGQWLGFFSEGKLKKMALAGGTPVALCDAPQARGASWGPDHAIVFTPAPRGGLWRIPEAGGTPEKLTELDASQGEISHRRPQVVAGGRAVLYTVERAGRPHEESTVWIFWLGTKERRLLLEGGANARYVAVGSHFSPAQEANQGYLVYARPEGLLVVPVDGTKLRVTGPPFPVLDDIAVDWISGAAHFSFSADGSLVYVPSAIKTSELSLFWVDRSGAAKPVTEVQRDYFWPRLSPDGRRLAVTISEAGNEDVWLYEIARDAFTRLTFHSGRDFSPVWSPDSRRVAFSSNRSGVPNLYQKNADGSGGEERLTTSPNSQVPTSWSPDGKVLAFDESGPGTNGDILLLPLEGRPGTPRPFLQTPSTEFGAVFSPDGRRLAYLSSESGSPQAYVQELSGAGGKWQVSTEGTSFIAWANHGRELVYWTGSRMMAVEVSLRPSFAIGKPRPLFEGYLHYARMGNANLDVAPDGRRFLVVRPRKLPAPPTQFNLVLNWFEELKRAGSRAAGR